MSDDGKPMTDEERRAFLEKWDQENLASMTPFERYLFYRGLLDDVIRPEITAEDVILEPDDHCIDVGCEHCIGYRKHDGRVSYCTHEYFGRLNVHVSGDPRTAQTGLSVFRHRKLKSVNELL